MGGFFFCSKRQQIIITWRIYRNAAAVIMHIAYGYTVKDFDDYFVTLAEECMRIASLAMKPGAWLVDSFPICALLSVLPHFSTYDVDNSTISATLVSGSEISTLSRRVEQAAIYKELTASRICKTTASLCRLLGLL